MYCTLDLSFDPSARQIQRGVAASGRGRRVRQLQLRHHFGPSHACFWYIFQPSTTPIVPCDASYLMSMLVGCWIGAWGPMLWPIWGFRLSPRYSWGVVLKSTVAPTDAVDGDNVTMEQVSLDMSVQDDLAWNPSFPSARRALPGPTSAGVCEEGGWKGCGAGAESSKSSVVVAEFIPPSIRWLEKFVQSRCGPKQR